MRLPTFCLLVLAALAGQPSGPALAQQQGAAQSPELRAAITKSNAYIGLMNRTLRAVSSWERYKSWVNLRTGPTGRERYIDYGLYSLYDVRSEIAKAREAMGQAPLVPELDAAVGRYIEAYEVLAPVITQANGYYERKDYKSDGMAEGRELHAKLVPAAEALVRERALLDARMRGFKSDLDRQELASIEAADGRKARWHVKNVMIEASEMVELLPTNAAPRVDMKAFDAALERYATAVRAMDLFAQDNPDQFSGFGSQPRSLLGKLRDMRDKLARANGDARRGAGRDLTWIVNDYNMMISSSQNATRFAR